MGFLSDRSNRRNLIAAGIIVWSLATVGCGLASSFNALFAARMLVGVGEAVLTPAAISLISDYFPPARRGRAVSVYLLAVPLGGGVAILVGGAVLGAVDRGWLDVVVAFAGAPWRAVLVLLGGPGVLLSLLLLLVREPVRIDDRAFVAGSAAAPEVPVAAIWKAIAPVFIGVACVSLAVACVSGWGPTVMVRGFGLPPSRVGVLAGLAFALGGALGILLGGVLGDRAKQRWGRRGRIKVCVVGALLALPCASFGMAVTLPVLLFAMGLFIACCDWAISGGIATILDYVPNRLRGLATSLTFFLNVAIGVGVGPLLVAWVGGGGLALGVSIFTVAAPVLALAATSFFLGLRRTRRLA